MSRKVKIQAFFYNGVVSILMGLAYAVSWFKGLARSNAITENKVESMELALIQLGLDPEDPRVREGAKKILFEVLGYDNFVPVQTGFKAAKLDMKLAEFTDSIEKREKIVEVLKRSITQDQKTVAKLVSQLTKIQEKHEAWS